MAQLEHPQSTPFWNWLFFITSSVATVAVTILSVLGFTGIPLKERSYSSWTANNDASSQQDSQEYEEATNLFGENSIDSILVIESSNFFEPSNWLALENALAELKKSEGIYEVIWIGSLPHFSREASTQLLPPTLPAWLGRSYLSELRKANPVPGIESSPHEWEDFETRVSDHPLVKGQLLSEDKQTMVVQLISFEFSMEKLESYRDTVREQLEPQGMRVRLTGTTPLYFAHRKAFDESHYRVLGLAVLIATVIAVIIFRDVRSLLLVGIGPALGGLWALGMIRWLGEPENDLTDMILPVMLVMVGFTDSTHLVIDIRHQKANGLKPLDATFAAMRRVGPACILTSITTSVSFLTLMLSDSEVISSFGQSSAIAIMITLIAIILTTPLVAVLIRGPGLSKRMKINRAVDAHDEIRNPTIRRLLVLPSLFPRRITLAGLALTVGLGLVAIQLQPDDRLRDRMPHSDEAWQAFEQCNEAFGGILFALADIHWPEQATDAEISQVIDEVAATFDQQERIASPVSIKTWLHALPLPPEKSPDLAMATWLPIEISQPVYRPEFRHTLVTGRMQDLGLRYYEPVIAEMEQELDEIEKRHPGFEISLTGEPIIEARFVGHVIRGLFGSLLTAAGVIFLTLTVAFRSLRLGLISIIPNALPLLAAAAIRTLFGPSLDIASACAFIIALGIAVDDTIHLIWRYQYEAKRQPNPKLVVERTVLGVGVPLTMTTLIMVAGLGTVTTSELPTHQYFGWIACTTLIVAWLGDLFLLPAMLTWWAPRSKPVTDEPTPLNSNTADPAS